MSDETAPPRRNDAALIRAISPLMFAFADKLFKFVGWGIGTALIGKASQISGNPYVTALYVLCLFSFTWALLLTLLELQVKDLSGVKLSATAKVILRVVLFVIGFAGYIAVMMPQLILDQVMLAVSGVKVGG